MRAIASINGKKMLESWFGKAFVYRRTRGFIQTFNYLSILSQNLMESPEDIL